MEQETLKREKEENEIIEEMDSQQIKSELQGRVIEEYAYSFKIGNRTVTGLSYAELSSIFPREAAEYVYVKIACGCTILSFVVGWLIILTGMMSASTVALGFAGYFQSLFGFPRIFVAVVLIGLSKYKERISI